MSYWRCYYHLVWATSHRAPLISPAVEAQLYPSIQRKARALKCVIHAMGGIEDHIHLVIAVRPHLAVAELVRQLKGSSAFDLNQSNTSQGIPFVWQRGYGVFTIGQSQIGQIIPYVLHQKAHHRATTLIPGLEWSDDKAGGRRPEPCSSSDSSHVPILPPITSDQRP